MKDTYKSKKDENITAEVVKCPNDNTIILKYLTGEHKDKTFTITTGTLKRWWKKVEKSALDILGVDMDEVNKPYPEPKEQKYIPKPQSVIEYEENKKRKVKLDFELPTDYNTFADALAENGVKIKRVNSGYIAMEDSSKLKLLTNGIGVLASTELAELLAKCAITSKPCIEKGTPFRFDIKTQLDYDSLVRTLAQLYKRED